MGKLRASLPVLKEGGIQKVFAQGRTMAYLRTNGRPGGAGDLLCAFHLGGGDQLIPLPDGWQDAQIVLPGGIIEGSALRLPQESCCFLWKPEPQST